MQDTMQDPLHLRTGSWLMGLFGVAGIGLIILAIYITNMPHTPEPESKGVTEIELPNEGNIQIFVNGEAVSVDVGRMTVRRGDVVTIIANY